MHTSYDQELVLAVIAGTILFSLLTAFIVTYYLIYRRKKRQYLLEMSLSQKQFEQELLQSKLETQEETFQHIGKELHDNVAQLLGTAKMLLGVTQMKFPDAPETLSTANDTLSNAIQELRFLSRSLDKEWLEQFNILENLKNEVERINAGETIRATIQGPKIISLKPEQQIILFRIVQEAIQNAIRHAQPSLLDIMILANHELFRVNVINNGNPLPENFHGMGTNNMKIRAELIGGTISWKSLLDRTIVSICLPVKK